MRKKEFCGYWPFVIGAVVCSVLSCTRAAASENWLTKASNSQADVVLHWVHLHEGVDTVQSIDVIRHGRSTRSLKVTGQPVFNEDKTLVAFPSCAGDGCGSDVQVVDLVEGEMLPAVRVPESGRVQFTCVWRDNVLRVQIETQGATDTKSTHEFPIARRP